jgi:hypothetical protein
VKYVVELLLFGRGDATTERVADNDGDDDNDDDDDDAVTIPESGGS